jgi:hypothetical protein
LVHHPHMIISVSLGAIVILIFPPPCPISSHRALRSVLGFPDNHKGCRCLDLSTNRVIISRHVVFDEQQFPFSRNSPAPLSVYDFLDNAPSPQWSLAPLVLQWHLVRAKSWPQAPL